MLHSWRGGEGRKGGGRGNEGNEGSVAEHGTGIPKSVPDPESAQ